MTNLTAALQGIAADDEVDESLAFDYAANGSKIVDGFIADVLDYLNPVEAPSPR